MEEKDFIKELFQEKLAQHQSPVSPKLWTSVSSSITSGTTVVSSGLSLLTKSIIGGLSAAAVIGGVWFMNQPASTSTKKPIVNANHPIEKTEKTNTEIPAISINKKKEVLPLNPSPIPSNCPVDDYPAFGPGILHNGSASCGPGISSTIKDPEVIPMLPVETTVSNQNIKAVSENPIANIPVTHETETASIIQEETIILPNIFTPNGDGKNDVFSIDLSAFEFRDYSLVILDMNNHVVFNSNNPQDSWNGKKEDGDVCPAGNYIYYLTGKTASGKNISKYSTLRIQH